MPDCAIALEKAREGRALDQHGRVQPLDQVFEFLDRQEKPRLAHDARLDFDQRRLPVEMPDDVVEAVMRNHDRLCKHGRRILKQDKDLSLVLHPPRNDGTKFRSLQRGHLSVPRSRAHCAGNLPFSGWAGTLMLTESGKRSRRCAADLAADSQSKEAARRVARFLESVVAASSNPLSLLRMCRLADTDTRSMLCKIDARTARDILSIQRRKELQAKF